MRIILPTLPDPTDQVIQNLTIGDSQLGPAFEPWQDLGVNWQGEIVMQGEFPPGNMPGFAVPRALVGWLPGFAQASSIGPMCFPGGAVAMVPIGPAVPVNPRVDPVDKWLYSQIPQDAAGVLFDPTPLLPSYAAPAFDRVLSGDQPLNVPATIGNPRREVKDSGSLKLITVGNPPPEFGRTMIPLFEGPVSYQVFTLTGTTVNGAGVPVGNCRVIAYQSGWRYVEGGNKIIAETISDGSGAFSLLLRNIDYQLVAYKEGSPDLGGLTRQDVTPVVAQTIYMRDPTAPDGPSGSAVYRPVGSPIVRRIA